MFWGAFFAVIFVVDDVVVASSSLIDEGRSRLSTVSLGAFHLFWDAEQPFLYVTNDLEPEKIVWQTIPSQSFITVG